MSTRETRRPLLTGPEREETAFGDWLGSQLRRMYASVAGEPLPDDLRNLLSTPDNSADSSVTSSSREPDKPRGPPTEAD